MPLTVKQEAFCVAVAKGETGSAAYRAAFPQSLKWTAKTIHEKASRLLADDKVRARLEELRIPALRAAEIEVQGTMQVLRHILYADPRRYERDDGMLKPMPEWDDAMAAAVSSIEVSGEGVHKIKFWSKVEALDKAMKHLGLFERDNRQKQESLAIQINLVGGKPQPPSDIVVKANLVEGRRG
jgi:phage terminase small subunit